MCFFIDPAKQDRPMQTTVWKVLNVMPDGTLISPVFQNAKMPWNIVNGVVRAKGTKYFDHDYSLDATFARCGIYVHLNQSEAEFWCGSDDERVIIELEVKPSDFLYRSNGIEGWGIATYKKVVVKEEQPYIKWY